MIETILMIALVLGVIVGCMAISLCAVSLVMIAPLGAISEAKDREK